MSRINSNAISFSNQDNENNNGTTIKPTLQSLKPPKAPSLKPLSEKYKKKAFAHFQKCKAGKQGVAFRDFEQQISSCLEKRMRDEDANAYIFTYSFVEFVILEVKLQNCLSNIPSYHLKKRMLYKTVIARKRAQCKYLWGSSTRHHARIYRKQINDALIRAGWWYSFRKHS